MKGRDVSSDTTGQREPQIATLLEALPYIRQFAGKTTVIKYGGAAMADHELREEFAKDVVLLKYVGLNPVIVHGGGSEITELMDRLGLDVRFVDGLRVSDAETVEVARMVLVGKINKDIVLRLNRHGQSAIGLCGDDGSLFEVTKRASSDGGGEQELGLVGEVRGVSRDVLDHVAADYIPVIASIGSGADGASYNINADQAAGAVAGALRAYKAIFLTDVEGWLRNVNDPGSLISEAGLGDVQRALEEGAVDGGMLPKLRACLNAVQAGVEHAHIVDGRVPHSLLLELFTDAGIGTKIGP